MRAICVPGAQKVRRGCPRLSEALNLTVLKGPSEEEGEAGAAVSPAVLSLCLVLCSPKSQKPTYVGQSYSGSCCDTPTPLLESPLS